MFDWFAEHCEEAEQIQLVNEWGVYIYKLEQLKGPFITIKFPLLEYICKGPTMLTFTHQLRIVSRAGPAYLVFHPVEGIQTNL